MTAPTQGVETPYSTPSTRAGIEREIVFSRELSRPVVDRATLPDLWERIRAGFVLTELEAPEVEQFAQHFARMGWLEKLAPRARRYLYLLVTEAEKRKLPSELALLPIIESGLNPQALSSANAAGLCQFIPETGRRFALHQSALVDRRRDLACVGPMYDYLQQNATQFKGDWFLALAAYNRGEGAVARALERNRQAGLPGDYLALRMPNETRAYVPQLLALKRLISDPERYGIRLPAVENRPTIDCEVALPQDMDVDLAARLAGITSREFRSLNPGIKKGVIPRATHPTICLPTQAVGVFASSLARTDVPLATWSAYTVTTTTSLASLAKNFGTSPETLRNANDIPPGMRLRSGATVLVPRGEQDADIPSWVAAHGVMPMEPDVPAPRKTSVRVDRKGSVATAGKRHRVQAKGIRAGNPGPGKPLRGGQKPVVQASASKKKSTRPTLTGTTKTQPRITKSHVKRGKAATQSPARKT